MGSNNSFLVAFLAPSKDCHTLTLELSRRCLATAAAPVGCSDWLCCVLLWENWFMCFDYTAIYGYCQHGIYWRTICFLDFIKRISLVWTCILCIIFAKKDITVCHPHYYFIRYTKNNICHAYHAWYFLFVKGNALYKCSCVLINLLVTCLPRGVAT